jgi:hypothetical protein
MEVKVCTSKTTTEEKESLLRYDYMTKKWVMYSVISTHYNKALQQGWTPLIQHVYEDGTVFGYTLEAPGRAVTIRSVEKKQVSKKQINNLTKKNT